MSIESARGFMAKVAQDQEFRKTLQDCGSRDEQKQLAQQAGFDFTVEELHAAQNELQDSDLDMVAGAGCCYCEQDPCPLG